ncbi:hypothetical protein Tco_0486963 [Tanacetum coccineum]
MSDLDESGVTYREISSTFEDFPDIGSPGVVGPEHDGLPWMPPSPDYMPGPEEPQSPPPLDYVLELVYPEFMPQKDEVFPAEEPPLPAAASPPAQSPDYAPSAEETEPFETDESAATPPPHPAYRVTARISIPAPVPTPAWSDLEVSRLLAISTPPSSPLSSWSSPLPHIPFPPLPPIPSPPLPVSSPVPMLSPSPPINPIRQLGYRAAMIRLRAEAASTSHSLLLPPPIILSHTRPDAPSSGTPPLHLLFTDRRADRPEVTLPPRRSLDYGFVATIDREIRRDLERDVRYGITNSWDEIVEAMQGTPIVTDVAEFSQRMTEFETRVRQDTDEIYTRLDDEHIGRQLLAGRLNMLFRDRRAHARTARLMETEARIELQSAYRRRQTVITEMLTADHKRQIHLTKALKLVKRLQTQMAELQRQHRPAKGPAQPELPEEADSSS